jgi:hypothetical protein
MSYMFSGATLFNGTINFLSTSNVTNMAYMFAEATSFDKDVNFTTSNVTNMAYMFAEATSFNKPLTLDTSSVTNMSGMFFRATSFDKDLDWDTSNVTNMSYMFSGATIFDQDLSSWGVTSLENAELIFEDSKILILAQSSGDYSKYPNFSESKILGPPPPSDPYYGRLYNLTVRLKCLSTK